MENKDIHIFSPSCCPFCGASLKALLKNSTYYQCGSHVWIEPLKDQDDWVLKGHTGTCFMGV